MTRAIGTTLLIVLGGTLLVGQTPQTPSTPATSLPPLPAGVQPPGPAPGVTMPRVIRSAKPAYTRDAMLRRVQGEVLMRAVVNTDGSVSDIIVIRSLDPELDQQAVRSVQQSQFAPATANGVPIRMAINYVADFNLQTVRRPTGEWPNGFTSNVHPSPLAQSTVNAGRVTLTLPQLEGWKEIPRQTAEQLVAWWNPRGWLLTIEQAQPAAVPITTELSTQELEQASRSIARGFGSVLPSMIGQVKAQKRPWVWIEMGPDASLTPPFATFANGAFKGGQRWAFATIAGDRNLVIRYIAYLPANAAPSDAQKQIAESVKEFSNIMNLVKITEP